MTDAGQIIYGDRVLFAPSRLPNRDKYIQWATGTTLGYTDTISGPLNFEEISTTNPTREKVKFEDWKHCRDICLRKNILPPTIGSQTASIPSKKNKEKKRKGKKGNLKSRMENI